jgi:hypothetical protein
VVVVSEQTSLDGFAPDTPEAIISRVQHRAQTALDQERGIDA